MQYEKNRNNRWCDLPWVFVYIYVPPVWPDLFRILHLRQPACKRCKYCTSFRWQVEVSTPTVDFRDPKPKKLNPQKGGKAKASSTADTCSWTVALKHLNEKKKNNLSSLFIWNEVLRGCLLRFQRICRKSPRFHHGFGKRWIYGKPWLYCEVGVLGMAGLNFSKEILVGKTHGKVRWLTKIE